MKTKQPVNRPNPLDKLRDQVLALGFSGGELNSGVARSKATRTYYFCKRRHSDMVCVNSSGVRLRSEPEFEVTVNLVCKDMTYTWDYETAEQSKRAVSSGMHARLVRVLGSVK